MGQNGKGSARRPMQVPRNEFVKRWEMALGEHNATREKQIDDARFVDRITDWMNDFWMSVVKLPFIRPRGRA